MCMMMGRGRWVGLKCRQESGKDNCAPMWEVGSGVKGTRSLEKFAVRFERREERGIEDK